MVSIAGLPVPGAGVVGLGQVLTVADRNGNKTTYTYTGGMISKITGFSGPTGARTATITSNETAVKISQASGTEVRTVVFEKDETNDLAAFVDANGKRTAFETWSGQVRKITSPEGRVTRMEYDSSDRLTKLTRVNSREQNSVTRLAYPSATQTLVAGPNTDQSKPVTAVARSTFTLDATGRVTAATDPMGRARSGSYTADFDLATATSGAGASAGTTTNTFGANGGQSLTKSTAPTGSSG